MDNSKGIPNFYNNKNFIIKDIKNIITFVNIEPKLLDINNISFKNNDGIEEKDITYPYILNNKTSDKNYISFIPSSFEKPKIIGKESCLKIVLDNNFDLEPTDKNYIFIDHHLCENLYNNKCTSNTLLLYNNYNNIKMVISKILSNKKCYINVVYHLDLDGICSSLLMKIMLYEIYNDINISNITKKFITILGEFGDVSINKMDLIDDSISNLLLCGEDINNFGKKIGSFSTNISRIVKIIRPYILKINISDDDIENMVSLLSKKIDSSTNSFVNIAYKFITDIQNFGNTGNENDLSIPGIINFCNNISNDNNYNILKLIFEEEMNSIVNNMVYPDKNSGIFILYCTFIDDPDNNLYQLLFIDNYFDMGRSLLFSYRGKLQYYKQEQYESSYKYYNHKYIGGIKKMIERCQNIACYNNALKKLVLDSRINSSSYDISIALGGGGHNNMDSSLGSVTIDKNILFSKINILGIL
jgi:hypothetical protein